MKKISLLGISLFMITTRIQAQITYLNPQINLTGYNSWVFTPKTDTIIRKYYTADYAFGFGLSNTFSTQSPFYIEVGVNYKTYGDRCCKNSEPVTKGYGVSRFTLINVTTAPKYYFNQTIFISLLVQVNWIINIKGFQNNSDFFIPIDKSSKYTRKRIDLSEDIHRLTFPAIGLAFGKELTFKKEQVGIVSIYAESPFKSIIKPAHLDDGFRIPRNIGISFGYGLRDKKYYHK